MRENAESVALQRRERQLEGRLHERLGALVDNLKRIIAVNRNLGFFTTGYNYLIQIIPALIVAPLFIRGEVEFGVITQSAMAFSHLLGAFSLVVTQFQAISSYAAVLARLNALADELQPPSAAAAAASRPSEDRERVAYEELTLADAAATDASLVRDLSLEIPPGARVLVVQRRPTPCAAALMRATAGVWDDGDRPHRASAARAARLPARAALPAAGHAARDAGVRATARVPPTSEMRSALATLGADGARASAPAGSTQERDWERRAVARASSSCVAVARVLVARPRFAFVDNLGADRSAPSGSPSCWPRCRRARHHLRACSAAPTSRARALRRGARARAPTGRGTSSPCAHARREARRERSTVPPPPRRARRASSSR